MESASFRLIKVEVTTKMNLYKIQDTVKMFLQASSPKTLTLFFFMASTPAMAFAVAGIA